MSISHSYAYVFVMNAKVLVPTGGSYAHDQHTLIDGTPVFFLSTTRLALLTLVSFQYDCKVDC